MESSYGRFCISSVKITHKFSASSSLKCNRDSLCLFAAMIDMVSGMGAVQAAVVVAISCHLLWLEHPQSLALRGPGVI